jgi:hypothetical protein
MLWETRVPESLASLPGRVVCTLWDEKATKAMTLPAFRTGAMRLEKKRAENKAYYHRNKERISAARKAKYQSQRTKPKQTREERLAKKAEWWANNRERIAERRRKAIRDGKLEAA